MFKRRNATAAVLLFSTVVVAFANIAINRYEYCFLAIPFVVAYFAKGQVSKIVQIIGLWFIGLYVFAIQKEYTGLLILFGAACMYFASIQIQQRFYILFSSLIIAICSFFSVEVSINKLVHCFLDAVLYCGGISFLNLVITEAIEKEKAKSVSIDQKYLEVIDELQHVAHESIDALKQLTSGDHGGRSGKGC